MRFTGLRGLIAAVVLSLTSTGAWGQTLDLNEAISIPAESNIVSSVPSTFTGININNFVGADRFYGLGITGQNATVANVEAGHIWSDHETLGHVSTFVQGSDAWDSDVAEMYDRHATWVGQVIGGRGGSSHQQGIARGATLQSGAIAAEWTGDAYTTGFDLGIDSFTTAYSTFFGSADVINSSWGLTDSTGTTGLTIAMDGLAFTNPETVFVASAGNNGPTANTVGGAGAGYNAITVGSLDNGGDNSYEVLASSSSRGPQSYGDPVNGTVTSVRAAVDIVTPGTQLTLAFYGGQTGGNNTTLTDSAQLGDPGQSNLYAAGVAGTSFAAPIVAGGATLLTSYDNTFGGGGSFATDTRVIKAVLLNSADKLSGWNNGQSLVEGIITTTQSLDWESGAGALNLDQAFDQHISGVRDVLGTGPGNQGFVDEIGWDFGTVSTAQDTLYFIDEFIGAGSTFTVTLTWLRERFFDTENLLVSDQRQADLDLFVFLANGDGITRLDGVAQSISDYNVVEHLLFDVTQNGYYGIGVSYDEDTFSVIGSGTSQEFGLAWSVDNLFVIPEPATGALMIVGVLFVLRRRRMD